MRTVSRWCRMSGNVKNWSVAVLALSVLFLVFGPSPAFAMIVTMPFPDLVRESNVIVIARVSDKVPVPKGAKEFPQIKNVLTIERALKGKLQSSQPLEIMTADTKGEWMEDVLAFPDKGTRVVLFLARGKDGNLNVVNGIQGVWPLKDGTDKTLGMGFMYSIEQIKKEIQSQSGAAG